MTLASEQSQQIINVIYKILHPQFEDLLLEKDSLREEIHELKTQVADLKTKISEIHKDKE